MKFKHISCMAMLGLLLIPATPSFAMSMKRDPGISVERISNSPVVTVTIDDPRARVVELLVAGRSVSTRAISKVTTALDLEFHVDMSQLDEGENPVEVRLYDETGTLLGSSESSINISEPIESPVEISFPKQGSTVQGLVEIKINLLKRFSKPYVSFMINGEWKAIRNYEPYTYIWDTETLRNGWQELQVWVVGDDNVTVRSRKVRVFVNNPGGRTERMTVPPVVQPVQNTVATATPALAPSNALPTMVVGTLARQSGVRVTAPKVAPVATTVRSMTPTGRRVATTKPVQTRPEVKPVTTKMLPAVSGTKPAISATVAPKSQPAQAAVTKVALAQGTRLPNMTGLSVTLNNSLVAFPDVQPFVQKGVAMTPFRHLFEHAGARVKWFNDTKSLTTVGLAEDIALSIGNRQVSVGARSLTLETSPFLLRNRTIIPLSFVKEALKVDVEVDTKTGHVLITKGNN